ncbi:MAG TPA: RNA polymerase sigma factor [Deltaproteobacteria bacterium]|jgi:RNA polymerase sigma factor (sigma-70 family)|nr:RNA polymerase sigma factor [Deltaproteobacteria bacterium]
MNNPFREAAAEDNEELALISRSLAGDLSALEGLVLRHQAWIYNIAVRMVIDPFAAEDITQEVLIKIITKLSTFDPEKSAFRTWVYRIVVNHIINAGKSRKEVLVSHIMRDKYIEEYAAHMQERTQPRYYGHDTITEEARVTCMHCILLSLNRRERMVFILGVIFGVGHVMGSEICGVSRDNFRKILSRGRGKVFRFFQKRCGLIKEDNPCRCEYHVGPMLTFKLIDPDDLLVQRENQGSIRDIVRGAVRGIEESHDEFVSLFRDQPFLKSPDMRMWLQALVERKEIKAMMQIP